MVWGGELRWSIPMYPTTLSSHTNTSTQSQQRTKKKKVYINKLFLNQKQSVVFLCQSAHTYIMEERELSVKFSFPSSMYTRLFLALSSAPQSLYTTRKISIKNVYKYRTGDNDNNNNNKNNNEENWKAERGVSGGGDSDGCENKLDGYIRTVQDEYGFIMQRKRRLEEDTYKCLYKHPNTNLTLVLSIDAHTSLEETIDLDEYHEEIGSYKQIIRDFIYCRENGMRIAIERLYDEYIDSDVDQLDYDCFNRYKFDCCVHIEWEYENGVTVEAALNQFLKQMTVDVIIYKLLLIISNRNLNGISDEFINIQNMTLTHNYDYTNWDGIHTKSIEYFACKYDGTRYNFSIFGKFIQIGCRCFEFENHWFGQLILGHCEVFENTNEIIVIDVYLITEDYNRIAKKYNISYTGALQNYHHFYNTNTMTTTAKPKSQDEYFHMKRLGNNLKFMKPLEAIDVIHLLAKVWKSEKKLAHRVHLQKFYGTLEQLAATTISHRIDGFLGFSIDKIYKIKENLTIDLLFKFDEMFRYILKRMKPNNQDIKKMIQFNNIQKTLNWSEFELKYPGKFEKFALEFLFFSQKKHFYTHYPHWTCSIDWKTLKTQLTNLNSTLFIILLEFKVDKLNNRLIFTRLRDDKFAANSMAVFKTLLKQFKNNL